MPITDPPSASQVPPPGAPSAESSPKPAARSSGGRWRDILVLVAGVGAAVYFLGVRPRLANEQRLAARSRQASQVSVLVVHPSMETSAPALNLPGSIRANQQTSIYSRVSGYLKEWKVDIGDRVEAGQLLAEIDAPEVDASVRAAQAQLALSEANLVLAKANSARAQQLFDKRVTSPQENDTAKASEQVAQATRDRDAAALQSSLDLQGFKRIRAPFAGTVTARYADAGALVAVGSATNVPKLFDLAQTDPVRVRVDLPQANIGDIQPDASAVVTVDEYPGETFAGKLARNAGAFAAASRTLTVEIDLPNPTGRLYAGMFARVRLVVPKPRPVLVLANNALLSDAQGSRVVTVGAGGRIAVRPVQLGIDYGTKTQILAGLDEGDAVVQNPTDDLEDGLLVSARPAAAPKGP